MNDPLLLRGLIGLGKTWAVYAGAVISLVNILLAPLSACAQPIHLELVVAFPGRPTSSTGNLVPGADGSLYGTTFYGGDSFAGTAFQVTTNGVLTTLVSFAGTNGANPIAGLTPGGDGNFYGTTGYGGKGYGTIFRLTTNGVLTLLFVFGQTNGAW